MAEEESKDETAAVAGTDASEAKKKGGRPKKAPGEKQKKKTGAQRRK